MKAAPEGVAMEADTAEPERQAFLILELLDKYRETPWYESEACKNEGIELLLEDLEVAYRFAMEPWSIHRTTPGELAQEDFYRWHEYMFPPDVFQEARRRFTALVTTTRFSVEEPPCLFELIAVNSPSEKITKQQIVSLAALVCIQFALEELEPLEFLDARKESEHFLHQIEEARSLKKNADSWLSHLATLDIASTEMNRAVKAVRVETVRQIKAEESERNKRPGYRKAPELTPEVIARYFNEHPGEKYEVRLVALSEKYFLSVDQVRKRHSDAKKKNLLS